MLLAPCTHIIRILRVTAQQQSVLFALTDFQYPYNC
jgi:hypothetical protein